MIERDRLDADLYFPRAGRRRSRYIGKFELAIGDKSQRAHGGVTGSFFKQFAVTVSVSTVLSAFNSLTLSPALAAILLTSFTASADANAANGYELNAIAAVRGTKWVVDVGSEKASTFVIAGRVAVSRPSGGQTVLLRAGDGADVSPDSAPIVDSARCHL